MHYGGDTGKQGGGKECGDVQQRRGGEMEAERGKEGLRQMARRGWTPVLL